MVVEIAKGFILLNYTYEINISLVRDSHEICLFFVQFGNANSYRKYINQPLFH